MNIFGVTAIIAPPVIAATGKSSIPNPIDVDGIYNFGIRSVSEIRWILSGLYIILNISPFFLDSGVHTGMDCLGTTSARRIFDPLRQIMRSVEPMSLCDRYRFRDYPGPLIEVNRADSDCNR